MSEQTWQLSERITALRAEALARVQAGGGRVLFDPEAWKAVQRIRIAAYEAHADEPIVLKRARAFAAVCRERPLSVGDRDLLAGSQASSAVGSSADDAEAREIRERCRELGIAFSDGHAIADYGLVISEGFDRLALAVQERLAAASPGDEEAVSTLKAMLVCADAAGRVGTRYAAVVAERMRDQPETREALQPLLQACLRVPARPARTFREALQSLWFTQVLLHWEDERSAVSPGRVDQHLWPWLERDLAAGRTSLEEAQELIDALWLKLLAGDESQNVTLGGTRPDGTDATNPVTLMCLRATARLQTWQPSLSLRVGDATPSAVFDEAAEVVRRTTGQPGFFSDAVVTAGLAAAGVPEDKAWDYGIVGCYEATGCGNHYGRTVAGWVNAPAVLRTYMAEAGNPEDFEAFFAGFLDALEGACEAKVQECNAGDADLVRIAPSPLRSILFDGCVARGRCVESGGASVNTSGVSLGGLGTTTDALLAIRRLVFEERQVTLEALESACAADFAGAEGLRAQLRASGPRYGTDDAGADAVAAGIATRFAEALLSRENTRGGRFMPGLHQYRSQLMGREAAGATPDGRCAEEPFSYGVGPSPLAGARSVTAAIHSAARLPQALCANGNCLEVALMPADADGPAGTARIRQLVEGYFELGGSQLTVNVVRPETLRAAREHPEQYGDLLVRMSGFSTRFTALDPGTQDDVIRRAEGWEA